MNIIMLVLVVSIYLGMEMVEIDDQRKEMKRQKERREMMDRYMGRI